GHSYEPDRSADGEGERGRDQRSRALRVPRRSTGRPDHPVEPVFAHNQVQYRAVGQVDVCVQATGPLGKVSELVAHDRLELAEVQGVDKAEADDEVPPGWHEQVQEG